MRLSSLSSHDPGIFPQEGLKLVLLDHKGLEMDKRGLKTDNSGYKCCFGPKTPLFCQKMLRIKPPTPPPSYKFLAK